MSKTFVELGAEIGELVEEKAAAYGDSFAKCGQYLRMLYPHGITPEEYSIAMLLARDFDKSMRLATNPLAFGESPFLDKAGYAILGAHMHQQERKASEPCPDTASADAAKSSSEDRRGSAATPNASETIMRSTAERSAPEPLPQPDGCSELLTYTPAPIATEAVSPSEEDRQQLLKSVARHLLELMRQCNSIQLCARCGYVINSGSLKATAWGEFFIVCKKCSGRECLMPMYQRLLEVPR